MERTLLRFVWAHSWRWQLLIVLGSFLSFPLILAALYIPKEIVNGALRGTAFPKVVLGLELEQLQYLVALCGLLLAMIFLNNGVKYYINVTKGLTGERILRRLRHGVFDRVTRLPPRRLRLTSPGEVVQIITAEVEPIGGFAGEIVATPVYQGGQLIVYLGFIIAQDPVLGLAAIILFPVQAYVVPKVQRIVVRLVQARIRNIRKMTAEISETITGIDDMRVAGARNWHLAKVSDRLYHNFRIRYRIFLLKYAIKFANNVINNVTPFFFYSFGGYLVIKGQMNLGALVAILAAYKDIAAPWRELLNFYQTYSDISARYDAVVATYGGEPLPPPAEPVSLRDREIALSDVSLPGHAGLSGASLTLKPGQSVLVLGEEEAGRGALVRILAGLDMPESGSIRVGDQQGRDLLVRAVRDIAIAHRAPHVMRGTLRDAVAYFVLADRGSGPRPEDWERREREARITGAPPDSPEMDWVDYARAGVEGREEFDSFAIGILSLVGLREDLFRRGLGVVIDPRREPVLVEAALAARAALAAETGDAGLEAMIEHWDPDRFLENYSLGENLFFGAPDDPADLECFCEDPAVRAALETAGIAEEVVQIGLEAARTLQELTGSLGPDSALLDRIGLIEPSERDDYAAILLRARRGIGRLGRADRLDLARLAFRLVPLRHRLGVLDDPARRQRIVAARQRIARAFRPARPFTRFYSGGYVPGCPLVENILRGRPRLDRRDASPPIEARLERVLDDHDMEGFVLRAGLGTQVGTGGNSLSTSQRRALGLARALACRPALLILDGVLDGITEDQVALRRDIRRMLPDAAIVHATDHDAIADDVDRVVRIAGGRIEAADEAAEDGAPGRAEDAVEGEVEP
ncbi:MAG: ABC transporter ATP-binding protein [Alphaproteobacteria bacterium]|nr:MAG: ABC transporter ATP-binding protein [Alphaproteobacteria bacterium]